MDDTIPPGAVTPDISRMWITPNVGETAKDSNTGVQFTREEVRKMQKSWELTQAAIEGEESVKMLGEKVLPRPNAADRGADNLARYSAYLGRAVWYNVAARTLLGLTGYVFSTPPIVKLPDELKMLEKNVDGNGVTLTQQAKAALVRVLAKGRCGLLVDYPTVNGATTRQDLLDGNVSPTIVLCDPENIINWRTSFKGSMTVLDLLVLRETYIDPNTESGYEHDAFEICVKTQYRVLKRTDAGVTGTIYRKIKDDGEYTEQPDLAYTVNGSDGSPLQIIPFTFIGSINNDEVVDVPPMLDIVTLNLAHFRNSADYEESCFVVGQPTPWISGLTEQWVKEVLKGTVHLGSRAILPLPIGGQAGLLQVAQNSMPHEAMELKEKQMTAIGAKLIMESRVMQTATEVSLDHSAEVSVLSAAATNVFLAYEKALAHAGSFVGNKTVEVTFRLSEPLTKETMTQDFATAVVLLWQNNIVDFEELRTTLRKTGIAWKTDADVKSSTGTDGKPPVAPPPATTPPVKKANPGGARV